MTNKIFEEFYENMSDDVRNVYDYYLEMYKENNYNTLKIIDENNNQVSFFSLMPIYFSARVGDEELAWDFNMTH